MKKNKTFIFCSQWNENAGGNIVLHKLCALLKENGCKTYLLPDYYCSHKPKNKKWYRPNNWEIFIKYARDCRWIRNHFKNPLWDTPVYHWFKFLIHKLQIPKDTIIVYPEVISFNPANASKVIRLIMHIPGYFTGAVNYGTGELYFLYGHHFGKGFTPPEGSTISPHTMGIFTIPDEYKQTNFKGERSGTAYLIRKGKDKPIIHDLSDSIKIDGMSHSEIAKIFNTVDSFISYDSVTAYSRYAMLCGCHSVIILGDGEKPETYWSDPEERKFIAWGLNDKMPNLLEAKEWAEKMKYDTEANNMNAISNFIIDTEKFFNCKLI